MKDPSLTRRPDLPESLLLTPLYPRVPLQSITTLDLMEAPPLKHLHYLQCLPTIPRQSKRELCSILPFHSLLLRHPHSIRVLLVYTEILGFHPNLPCPALLLDQHACHPLPDV